MTRTACDDQWADDRDASLDEMAPVLDKEEMLQLLALRLPRWPQDSGEYKESDLGWGWEWHDVPPDCEFVLAVPGREGREWCITESDWHKARWGAGEERIDRIAQSDASGDHYPPTCADGLPCGVAHSPGDDAYCLRCPHEPLDGGAEPVLSERDAINPSHYRAGKVECIDALESATVNKSGIEAVCTANAIKYLWRYESKGGAEDVRKARWYIERLLRALEAGPAVDRADRHRGRAGPPAAGDYRERHRPAGGSGEGRGGRRPGGDPWLG